MMARRSVVTRVFVTTCSFALFFLTHSLTYSLTALAAERPSIFRGVVVTDSPPGVRVVSVDAGSQAALADLQPEDLIVRVNGAEIHSIDEFAVLSGALKGRTVRATVVIFRNGQPLQLVLHLFSYPVLRAWGLAFVPDDELRFAEPRTGWVYWTRLGSGFERAGQRAEALDAYLNALHHLPTNLETAVKVSELSLLVSQQRLEGGALADGVSSLRQGILVMQRLFDQPLTAAQLEALKRRLQATLHTLHALTAKTPRLAAGRG